MVANGDSVPSALIIKFAFEACTMELTKHELGNPE